jgi:hypothetical protein
VGHHLDEVRKIILNLAFLGVVGLLVFAAAKVLRSDDLMIDAIGLPKNIKDLGYTEDGAALILSDNIRQIAEAAKSDGNLFHIKTNFDEQDITVPVEGLSFGSIHRLLRQTLGLPQNRLIGDFVCTNEPCSTANLELRLRTLEGVGAPKPLATIRGAGPDAILQAAAERYMQDKTPMALSLSLYERPERREEALSLALSRTAGRRPALNEVFLAVRFEAARKLGRAADGGELSLELLNRLRYKHSHWVDRLTAEYGL